MVDSNQVTDAALQTRTVEAKQAIAEIAREITPSAVQLLQGLDDQQVKDMSDALARTCANARTNTSSRRWPSKSRIAPNA